LIQKNKGLLDQHQVKVETHIDGKLTINADDHGIEEILNNLISNAVTHIPKTIKGKIVIRAADEKNEVHLSISDNGKGMTTA
jgi:signal transduction histidine kinase